LNPNQAQGQGFDTRRDQEKKFTHIPMTYIELLPNLFNNALAVICPMKPLQPPYPKYYDASAKCDYHSEAIGHSIENCRALKFKVQSLIDSGWLTFQVEKPSVDMNPLSGHANVSTNAVMDKEGQSLVRRVDGIRSSLKDVFIGLCQMGLSEFEYKP